MQERQNIDQLQREGGVKHWDSIIRVANGKCDEDKPINVEEIFENNTKSLVSDYIDDRLIRSGLNMKRSFDLPKRKCITMQHLKDMRNKRNDSESEDTAFSIEDVSKLLICVGEYLESSHHALYTDVLQQLNVRSIGDTDLNSVFITMGQELFSKSITWAKIVSLFAFAGGLATDCALGGFPKHVSRVKDWTYEFIETELMEWIQGEGGWITLLDHFLTEEDQEESSSQKYWTLSAFILVVSVVVPATLLIWFKRFY